MATRYGPVIGPNIGSAASKYPIAYGAHNFQRSYYTHKGASGDVRAHYEDLYFDSTGSGETYRPRAIANGLLCATGGTINAIHATGRVAAAKTVSGALNAIRATLEVAGTTPSPGGTLAALQLDSNIVTGATISAPSAFVRVTDSGTADLLINLLSMPVPSAKNNSKLFVAVHADSVVTHAIRIVDSAGTPYWIQCTTDTPAD